MTKILPLLFIAFLVIACNSQATLEAQPETQPETQQVAQITATSTLLPTQTNTPVPPTNTPTSTSTPLPPTATSTHTPTSTSTSTSTPTPTDTPIPPTDTPIPTNTAIPPTPTKSAANHLEQAQALYGSGDGAGAIVELQMALQLQPDLAEAYKLLGLSYNQQGELEPGIQTLEQYLQLVPEASDKAEIQAEIQRMRDKLAAEQFGEVPPGKAMFVFINYTGDQWNVDVGTYFLEVPPKPVDQDIFFKTQAIDPGSYTWSAMSPGGGNRAEDASGNKAFNFTVATGELKVVCVGGGSSQVGSSEIRYGPYSYTRNDTSYTSVKLCGN